MRMLSHALVAGAAIALLAGCGAGSQGTVAGPGASYPGSTQSVSGHPFGMQNASVLAPGVRILPPSHQSHGVSYNACGTTNLLFVSDASNNLINIYNATAENATACGSITGNGLSLPQGIDVDTHGNLYVANTLASDILEFAPPYTGAPIKTMTDVGQYPAGVEAECGTKIWVTNIITTGGGAGTISDYSLTGTAPLHTYADVNATREYFIACDPAGNVYTTYSNGNTGAVGVNMFTKATHYKATDLHNQVTMAFPGGIDWEGTQTAGVLYIDDQTNKTIQGCVNGTGTCTVAITMSTAGDPVTFDVNKADDDAFTADASNVTSQVWDFAGSAFDKSITATGQPIGVALYPDDSP
jgi:hypothetical protein